MLYDVVIIGAGPAGLSAGIYASRAGAKTLIVEKFFTGGQATQTYEIENYPGYTKIGGFELMQEMEKQAISCGVELKFDELQQVDLQSKTITFSSGEVITAKAIIIASGATHKSLGVEGEESFVGAGLSYCATCDGAFFKNQDVAVVGGGNTAVGDCLYLSRFAKKVYIIHRRNEFRATPILVERMQKTDTIIKTPYVVKGLKKDEKGKLCAVVLENKETKEEELLDVSGIFVAVGQVPSTEIFDVEKDEKGYIITDENMKTNVDGVFAVGDCRAKVLRQIVTATADGAIAGEEAVTYITINNK